MHIPPATQRQASLCRAFSHITGDKIPASPSQCRHRTSLNRSRSTPQLCRARSSQQRCGVGPGYWLRSLFLLWRITMLAMDTSLICGALLCFACERSSIACLCVSVSVCVCVCVCRVCMARRKESVDVRVLRPEPETVSLAAHM
ncbi:hypothetical protein KC19_4G182800 [Ceratodon purpureus]|uniref:Uncharacterized protein n=1 Tax=Ceratodon purpureus TaxID=3225 RepID=A0A8T0IA49_CERPU|nr:hypothetical protein KC19_4G182800 [Ceratodon purpureus]